jgi:GH15 family glucan-1,4-alpha-glucosidase
LKGLTYAATGALVAAPTTSLPETPGGERNWDYRYTWVRDSTFALWALYTLGLDRETDDFFSFIRDVAAEDDLQIMYGIGGERDLPESMVEGLEGYDGARPVRVGNAAVHQRQLDVWGAMLDSVYLHAKSRDQLPEPLWPVLLRQVEQAAVHWRDTETAAYSSSPTARQTSMPPSSLFPSSGSYPPMIQPCVPLSAPSPMNSPGTGSSCATAPRRPTTDSPGEEGTFTTCSFWLVSALVEIGEVARAKALRERLLSLASPPGLYAEELDPVSGRHLGNFPQAFTHLALINALMHLIRAEETNRAAQFAPAHRHT